MSALLEIKDLAVSFRTDAGRVEAVRGISYTLEEGEVLGIVGESGCGKSVSTLALMGLIRPPGQITAGQILYKGQDLLKLSEREWRRFRGNEFAMIFQDPMTSLNPFMSIGQQIGEVLSEHTDLGTRAIQDRCVEVLEAVGLPDPASKLHVYPHQFSGGMRQRVMIAMALAASPKILLADEPTTALDVTIQAQILDVLTSLQEQEQLSIVFITHDLGVVADFCDRVQVMYAGRIVERGETAALFRRPGHPYTQGLLRSIPRVDAPTESLVGIPGQPPALINPPKGCAFAPRCPIAQDDCRDTQPNEVQQRETSLACFHHELAAQQGGEG